MAIRDFGERPFGLTEVIVTESGGGAHALLAERVLVFRPVFDSDILQGGDVTVEVGSRITHYEWELEEGGIPLALYVALIGGTVSATAATDYYFRRDVDDIVPYNKIQGRAISEDGGDIEVTLYRCRATGGVEGRLEMGSFYVTNCSGIALRDTTSPYKFLEVRQKSVAAAIS